jgi:ribosomal protein L7/L12
MPLDQEHADRIARLEGRMSRLEAIVEQLLHNFSGSRAQVDETRLMTRLLYELRGDAAARPMRESPQLEAVRAALRLGDRMQAIKLYRAIDGASMQEAQDALERL